MKIGGQHFSAATLERIQQTVQENPSLSRRSLSRQICQWLDWRSPNGQLKEMSCRKALSQMQRRGLLSCPKVEQSFAFQHPAASVPDPVILPLHCSLADLGEIQVSPVRSRRTQEAKIWTALLDRYHYLGSGPLCGAQLRYLVKCEQGYLGALAFSSATFALACRDRFIGWSEAARRSHLGQVVCNSRFLILPQVKVPNLASHILSLALARLPSDWQERYQTPPLLVETFVSPDYPGTCYQAANFTCVGESAGRRDGQPKQVYLYPLAKGWRKALCAEPEIRMPRPEAPQDWAETEFGTIQLYDERLKQRLYTVARDFYNALQANIPEACKTYAKTEGAYRLLMNPKVSMEIILKAHTEAAIERIKKEKVVLCPQDTTSLDYATHPMTGGLGPIGKGENSLGLLLHDTLAFTEQGTPLGVLQGQCWARKPESRSRSRRKQPAELPAEQKESAKWLKSFRLVSRIQKQCPDTLLVSIGDREADIYDLFREAAREGEPGLLVRATKSRQRKVEGQDLWSYLAHQEIAVTQQIRVPRQDSKPDRLTWLDIRFARVTLQPPQGGTTPLTIRGVYAVENPRFVPAGKKPIEWLLLTTLEVRSAEEAIKMVEWYTKRWGIEVYHKTLKSGCRMEDRQLEEAERLETCLGVDMVVAWRVNYLRMLAREQPEEPCTLFFTQFEWQALHYLVKNNPFLPAKPPSMREAVLMVASRGGHLGRKGDGFPGIKTIWHGLVELIAFAQGIAFATQHLSPDHSGP